MADVSDSRCVAGTAEYRDFTAQRDDRSARGTSSPTGVSVESLVTAAAACAFSADRARANSHQPDERLGRDRRGDIPVHLQG